MKSWITNVSKYINNDSNSQALNLAVSYLGRPVHEWCLGFKKAEEIKQMTSWVQLKEALSNRFETLNKSNIARDNWDGQKQIKDVAFYNEGF